MALKNAWIASANPSAVANKNYINALYVEKYGRNATQAELDRFSWSSVKDAANIILGQSLSPFANSRTWWTTSATTSSSANTSAATSATWRWTYISNEADLQSYRNQLASLWIPQSEWSKYISKWSDWKMYFTSPTTWAATGMSDSNMDPNTQRLLEQLMWEIDNNPNYSTAEKQIMKYALSQSFASGNKIWSKDELRRVLAEAAENAKTSLEPYYEKMKYEDLEDYKKSMEDLRLASALYTQQEAKSYKELLDKTKKEIRKWGWMESWESRRMLWKESALQWDRDWGYSFEGVEWELPQQRRYDWEEYSTNLQRQARDAWIWMERKYGSQVIWGIQDQLGQLSSPYDLKSGNIDYQKGRYIPSYLAKQKWQNGYVRTDMETWAGYTWDYWLDKQKEQEKLKYQNLERYWLYF